MKMYYGLIGHPLGHSISSKIHQALYQYYQMDGTYLHFDVLSQQIPEQLEQFRRDFRGFNVTIPYKQEIIPYLDEVRDDAALFGAVNTVVVNNGRLIGYNTDGLGFMKLLKQNGITVKDKRVVLLGAGGAGSALAQKIGTEGAKEIVLLNRSLDRAKAVADRVYKVSGCFSRADVLDGADDYLQACDVLINTTSLGMYPHTKESPLGQAKTLTSRTAVVDIIYNPGTTKLMEFSRNVGCTTVNGLGMLLYQAFYAFELWTGIMPPDRLELQLEQQLAVN